MLQARSKQDEVLSETLRVSNYRLKSTVQELRLEIAYYQGEAKRLEWEKNVLKQDVGKMSALFQGWLNELQNSNTRDVVNETDYIQNLVNNPTKNIAEILQISDLKLLVTSCQAPFFIEHTNKAWSLECGWESHEVLGLTCAFLQGELSHLKTASDFSKSMRETGYANMRINNYRKNGTVFNVVITSFPIYDSVSAVGESCDVPTLTHFATILSDVRNLTSADMSGISDSVMKDLDVNLTPSDSRTDHSSQPSHPSHPHHKTSAFVSHSSCSSSISTSSSQPTSSSRHFDRRVRSQKFDPECRMTSEVFLRAAATIRLSDLMRLMLSCGDAMVLTDRFGRIVHCNRPWVQLTGHSLNDAEGLDCDILHGSMTDTTEIRRCHSLHRSFQSSVSTVVNYRKDGLMFTNSITTSPIRGAYMNGDVSHFCALQIPEQPQYNMSDAFGLTTEYSCSNSSCSIKRNRMPSLSDSDSDDNSTYPHYKTDGKEAPPLKVKTFDREFDFEFGCLPPSKEHFYTDENTAENENHSGNTSEDRKSELNSSSSSSSTLSMRNSQNSQNRDRDPTNKTYGHANVHSGKSAGKHLRIQSSVDCGENDGNSSISHTESPGSLVDSPITDGNESP